MKTPLISCKGCNFLTNDAKVFNLHTLNCPEMIPSYFEEELDNP